VSRERPDAVRVHRTRVIAVWLALMVSSAAMADGSAAGAPASGGNQSPGASATSADATQSFISPLGLGSGATISVTQKGATATAAIDQQFQASVVNFFQAGLSGTTNTNGQASVYSSTDSGAPGLKGKVGVGYSSFQGTKTADYTAASDRFKGEVWCINVAAKLAGLSISSKEAAALPSCAPVIAAAQAALAKLPAGKDAKTIEAEQAVLSELQKGLSNEAATEQAVCPTLKPVSAEAFNACPDSGAPDIGVSDVGNIYTALYARIVEPTFLPALYFKASLNWSPNLVSTDYRSVTNGVPNLATSEHWSSLLNAVAADGSLYYKAWSFGAEAAYGKTVDIKQQNVCKTQTNGAYTAQSCENAMIGRPEPVNTASGTAALSYAPAGTSSIARLFRPGIELLGYFEHPSGAGGHKTELSLPLYLTPIATPLKAVIGLQPMWTWNSETGQKNDFSVLLFVGARPSVPN
jgi:hypothetical protein